MTGHWRIFGLHMANASSTHRHSALPINIFHQHISTAFFQFDMEVPKIRDHCVDLYCRWVDRRRWMEESEIQRQTRAGWDEYGSGNHPFLQNHSHLRLAHPRKCTSRAGLGLWCWNAYFWRRKFGDREGDYWGLQLALG
jgi:hypothetical protein